MVQSKTKPKKKSKFVGCSLKQLPQKVQMAAAATAISINPANAPMRDLLPLMMTAITGLDASHPDAPRLGRAMMTNRYWGSGGVRLTVGFLEPIQADLRNRILSHMNAWHDVAGGNVQFTWTQTSPDVRITRSGDGYWSYLGTDIRHIPAGQPTMCLQAFTMNTPESEYRRVVRHETGHTIGMPHEHLRKELRDRIDPSKAYPYFRMDQGWDKATVDSQVLSWPDENEVIAVTVPDQYSVMCYLLPGSITYDGKPIVGGTDIDDFDKQLIAKVYPLAVQPPPPPPPPGGGTPPRTASILIDWDKHTLSLDGKPV